VRERPLGLACNESLDRGAGRRAFVDAILPQAVEEPFARQTVGPARHQDRELRLAGRGTQVRQSAPAGLAAKPFCSKRC
jgi:hypothetical protein